MRKHRLLALIMSILLCLTAMTPVEAGNPPFMNAQYSPKGVMLSYLEALDAGDKAAMLNTFDFGGNYMIDGIRAYIDTLMTDSIAAEWPGHIDDVDFVDIADVEAHFTLMNYAEVLSLYTSQLPEDGWRDVYAVVRLNGESYLMTMICVSIDGSWYNYDINGAFAIAAGYSEYDGIYPYDTAGSTYDLSAGLPTMKPIQVESAPTTEPVFASNDPTAEPAAWEDFIISADDIDNTVIKDNGDIIYYPSDDAMAYDADEHIIYFDNVIKVFLSHAIDKARADEIAAAAGGYIAGHISGTVNLMQIKIPENGIGGINEIADRLMTGFDEVLFAGYEYPIEIAEDTVGDPWDGDANYDVDNPDGSDWYIEAIDAPTAWDIVDQVSGRTQTVYPGVLDAGFYTAHPDLAGRIRLIGSSPENDHGTMVAGIISANADNGEGARGILTNTDVYCKAYAYTLNTYGTPIYSMFSDWSELLSHGALVINNSFGENIVSREVWNANSVGNYQYEFISRVSNSDTGDPYLDYLDYHIKAARREAFECAVYIALLIKEQRIDDFMFVQSAGNGYDTLYLKDAPREAWQNGYFASIDEGLFDIYPQLNNIIDLETLRAHTMIVGAVENTKQANGNYTRYASSNYGSNVDIWAPGKHIYSYLTSASGLYSFKCGTSCAAPIVTASLVLLMNLRDDITAYDAKQYLINNASGRRDLTSTWMDNTYPMLNLGAAAKAAMGVVDNNGGDVVGYRGDYYYWRYNSGSLASEDYMTTFDEIGTAVNELIRRDKNGRETVVVRDTGYGGIYISNNMIFYRSDYRTYKAVSPEGKALGTFEGIVVIGVDDKSGNLIYRLYDSGSGRSVYMLDAKLNRTQLLGDDGGNLRTFYGILRSKLYYGYISSGTAYFEEHDIEKNTGKTIASISVPLVADQYYDNTTLGEGYIDNAALYVSLGWCWDGTGAFYATGGLYSISLNEGNALRTLIDYYDEEMTYDRFVVFPTESSDRRLIYYVKAPDDNFAPTLRDYRYQPYYDASCTKKFDTLSGVTTDSEIPFVPDGQFCYMNGGIYSRHETDAALREIVSASELAKNGYATLQDFNQDYVDSVKRFNIVGDAYFFEIQQVRFSEYGRFPMYARIKNTLYMVVDGEMTEIYSY